MRAFDRHAIEGANVPSLVLMENAGRGAFEALLRLIPSSARSGSTSSARGGSTSPEGRAASVARVAVVCGPGNNGGDGFVLARHLLGAAKPVVVGLVGRVATLQGDAKHNADALCGVGGAIVELIDELALQSLLEGADWIVDALFGTGLSRPIDGFVASVIERINRSPARRLALDIPSGIDANSGEVLGVAVRAYHTVTFAHEKLGLLSPCARPYVGSLEVTGIGVPSTVPPSVGVSAEVAEEDDVRAWLALRPVPRHKGEAGRILLVAGAPQTVGAARLAAHAALRAGAGLVQIATFGEAARALQASNWEVMTRELSPSDVASGLAPLVDWADAIVVGPGLGLEPHGRVACEFVLANAKVPLVFDADGLNHFAGAPQALRRFAPLVITPHPTEAARLLDTDTPTIESDRFAALRRLADETRAAVLLKGERTLILGSEPQATPRINMTGSPALAVGGSGDVLSGILGALCCHLPVIDAATAAAWLHGKCGERCPPIGTLAREIADALPEVMRSLRDG